MTEPGSTAPASDGSQVSLADLRRAIHRNRVLLLGTTAAVMALTALATVLLPPVYESTASVRIQSQDSKSGLLGQLGSLAGGVGLPGLGDDEVSTEIGVIRSRRITEPVAESLGIHLRVLDHDGPRSEVLRVIRAPAEAVPGTYSLRRESDGRYRLSPEKVRTSPGSYTRSEPRMRALVGPDQRVEVGSPFRYAGMELALAPAPGLELPDEIRFRVDPFREAVEELREDRLRVARVEGSSLVALDYRNSDPELAAAVVNGITRSFVDYKMRSSSSDSRSREDVLLAEVEEYERRIADLERRMREFQEREMIVAPEEQATQQVKRVAALQAEKDALVVERSSLATLLAELAQASLSPDAPSPYRKLATFPSFISNGAIQDMLQSLVELENERAELLVRRTPQNADVVGFTQRIEELEGQLYRLGRDYLDNLNGRIASADRVLAQFAGELRAMPAREIQFARMMREQEMLGEVYLLLQTQLKQEQVQGEMTRGTGEVRVIDLGVVPEEPIFPQPVVNLLMGLVLGLMLGMVAVIGREALNTTVRSTAEAESAAPGLPVLGSIPRIGSSPAGRNGTGHGGGIPWRRIVAYPYRIVSPEGALSARERLVARWAPHHPAAEAFRSLHTNVAFAGEGRDPQVVAVTSARPAEGKSTVAANLAVTLVRAGNRTLLIDADLRRGVLEGLLGGRRDPGLSDVLRDRASAAAAIQEVPAGENGAVLHLLAAGSPTPEPAELLGSAELGRLLDALRGNFDRIVLDTPACGPIIDAALVSRLADSTLVVVRAGATEPETLRATLDRLRRVEVHLGGIVLNQSYDIPARDYAYSPSAAGTEPAHS